MVWGAYEQCMGSSYSPRWMMVLPVQMTSSQLELDSVFDVAI
jgi:hypothetical protein